MRKNAMCGDINSDRRDRLEEAGNLLGLGNSALDFLEI